MAVTKALSAEDGNLNRSFLGARQVPYKDIDLSMVANLGTGDIYRKTDAEAVKQGVKNLLMTNQTEKPFQPHFGADFESLLFDLMHPEEIEESIKRKITNAIRSFEPRAKLITTVVNAAQDQNKIFISITFSILNTDTVVRLTTTVNRLR